MRHSKPRLFRVAFGGGGGRVVGLGHIVVFVCGVCDGQTGPTLVRPKISSPRDLLCASPTFNDVTPLLMTSSVK